MARRALRRLTEARNRALTKERCHERKEPDPEPERVSLRDRHLWMREHARPALHLRAGLQVRTRMPVRRWLRFRRKEMTRRRATDVRATEVPAVMPVPCLLSSGAP